MAADAHTRRAFLQGAAAALAAPTLPSWFVRDEAEALAELDQKRPRRIGPNDRIQVGLIGAGGSRGGYSQGLNDARHLHGIEGVMVTAVCDVDGLHLSEARDAFGPETKAYQDYRELLAKAGCDAVVIGTPDHWHHRICLDSLSAGLDVYCEKPLTLAIQEGRDISRAAQKGGRIFQTGSQQRSDRRFRLACQIARSGRLGQIRRVRTVLPGGPTGGPFDPQPVPQDFDWPMWLGPAPLAEYTFKRTHGDFRWWLDYSGGMLTDWGAHHHDIAQWGLGMDESGPVSVQAAGVPPRVVSSRHYSTFPEFDVEFIYSSGVVLHSTNKGDNGVTFEGDEGWVFVSRGEIKASRAGLLTDPLPASAPKLYVSDDHGRNFIDGMRSRTPCICTAETGHRSATLCHLANISLRLGGRKLKWDPAKEDFIGDPEAGFMRSRPQKRDWEKR